jgi:hypothetical protein
MTLFERVRMPSFAGATEWLNSEPLGPAGLEGRVVLANFWTWTCINWLRQEPYVRAWSRAYRDDGLVVIGVHTPEFSFEHEVDGVRQATTERAIDYPVAVDNDYAIWNAFSNHAWPALYFATSTAVSATGTSAKAATRSRSGSSRSCSASSASLSRSKASGTRRRPTGTTCARPRRTSATGAARTSPRRTAPPTTNTARTRSPTAYP